LPPEVLPTLAAFLLVFADLAVCRYTSIGCMREIKLYDRRRTPSSWMNIVRPGEFAVFHHDIESGAMTDVA
jgi:hypothetical protein